MISVAVTVVENCPDVLTRTRMVWLLEMVPAAEVNGPPSIEYSPPVIDTAAAWLMPLTVMLPEVAAAERVALDWSGNVNVLGVVSTGGGLGVGVGFEPPPPPPPHPAR